MPSLALSLQDLQDEDVRLFYAVASDAPDVDFALTDQPRLFQKYNITGDRVTLFRKVRRGPSICQIFAGGAGIKRHRDLHRAFSRPVKTASATALPRRGNIVVHPYSILSREQTSP